MNTVIRITTGRDGRPLGRQASGKIVFAEGLPPSGYAMVEITRKGEKADQARYVGAPVEVSMDAREDPRCMVYHYTIGAVSDTLYFMLPADAVAWKAERLARKAAEAAAEAARRQAWAESPAGKARAAELALLEAMRFAAIGSEFRHRMEAGFDMPPADAEAHYKALLAEIG